MDLSKAKVCIPTSSGGHLTHMRMLMPALSKAADRFWVTFDLSLIHISEPTRPY